MTLVVIAGVNVSREREDEPQFVIMVWRSNKSSGTNTRRHSVVMINNAMSSTKNDSCAN